MAAYMKMNSYQKGLLAEFFAKLYFIFKAYRILEHRFKTPYGEIDLIVKRGKTLIFVEVKLRKTLAEAAESVNKHNQYRIIRTAELYLQQYPEYNDCEMRFDVFAMALYSFPKHIKNAWSVK